MRILSLPTLLLTALLFSSWLPATGDGLDSDSKRILSKAKKEIVSEDGLRGAGLAKLMALAEPNPEQPIAAIAQAIAKGLAKSTEPGDGSFRALALKALSDGRHQGTAIEAFVKSLDTIHDELEMLDTYYPSVNEGRMPTGRAWDYLLFSTAGVQMNYVVAFDDERCEKALLKWMKVDPKKQMRYMFEMEAHALTQMGTQGSIAAVISAWQGLEKKLRKGPITGLASIPSTPVIVPEDTIGILSIISKLQPANENSLRLIHDDLLAKIVKEELPAGPAWSDDTAAISKLWKTWLKANGKSFKKKLGKLPDDAPVTPTRPIAHYLDDEDEE